MKTISKLGFLSVACAVLIFSGTAVFAQTTPQVQTNYATNIQNSSATLNASITDLGSSASATIWFQWGTTTSYGNQTYQQTQGYTGTFSQGISGLSSYTTYHFRVVAQNTYGTLYGQDMTFYTSQTGSESLTASAGSDLYLTSGQTTTLQGSGYDSSGYSLTYSWTCSGGTLSNYYVAQPVYTAPYNYSSQTTYTCTLTVSNSYGNSNSDSVNIYINSSSIQVGGASVQTNSATNVSNYQATLNGYLSVPYLSNSNYVWFQYGTDTNYGSNTSQQSVNSGSFTQNIANLSYNTTYHFRAVAQGSFGTIYGQDMTFNSNGSTNYYGNGTVSVTKQVINLTSGNLNWQSSVSAKPNDILSFAITIQAGNQDIHNVMISDILPTCLTYKGNLTVNANLNYLGNPASGINIGTIPANGIEVVAFQAQAAPATSFLYGTTSLINTATVTSTEGGSQNASATVIVNNSLVNGATTVSTGMTNNPITDSFFLPIMLIIAGSWFYFSGNVYKFSDWIGTKIK